MYFHHHSFFFFNDTATTEIYTLSLHDALPISASATTRTARSGRYGTRRRTTRSCRALPRWGSDRKSTRLNSSHQIISYAVFCLKKKKHTAKKSKTKFATQSYHPLYSRNKQLHI